MRPVSRPGRRAAAGRPRRASEGTNPGEPGHPPVAVETVDAVDGAALLEQPHRLRLEPGPANSVECLGVLLREQQRPFYSILDRAFPRSRERLIMCSLCKRIHAFDLRWLELEDAIQQLDLFDSANLPEIDYAVCDRCVEVDGLSQGGSAAG